MEVFNWKKILLPYEQAVNELCTKFEGIASEYNRFNKHSPVEMVVGRVKSVGSILEKANRKNISYSDIEEKIEDIAGVRIICRFVEDIDKVVKIIKKRNGIDLYVAKERDYVRNMKPSGYRSYHLILRYPIILSSGTKEVNCEVQIRTLAMNFWATIEHSLKYKYNNEIPDDLKERLTASADAAFNLDKEMSTIRDEIMEAQKIIQMKNELVDKIIHKMQNLYGVAKLDRMNKLDEEFTSIYLEGSLDKLQEFNNRLNMMVDLYRVGTY